MPNNAFVALIVLGLASAQALAQDSKANGQPSRTCDVGAYRLVGEGTGKKDATAAAANELGALSPQQISALLSEANAGKR